MLAFIGSLVLVVAAAFIQMTDWLVIGNTVKPDLLLAFVVVLLTVNPNWVKRLVMIAVAALVVKENPGLTSSNLIFPGTLVLSALLLDFLPWQRTITALLAVAAGTLIMNIQYFSLLPFIYELAINLIFTFTLLNLLPTHVPQIKLQRHRF